MTRLFIILMLLAPAACAPIVAHGPRVEPGLRLAATAGVARNLCDTACALSWVPQLGLGARYGRPAAPGRVGFSVGGMLSAAITSSELDLYVQAPGSTAWAAGGGVLLSPSHLMPYLQAGRMDAGGSGFYTTQGFALMASRPRHWNLEELEEVAPRYWAPTVAYRAAQGDGAIHFYLSGAFGWMHVTPVDPSDPDRDFPSTRQPVSVLMAGISFEALMRGFQPLPPPAAVRAP